MSETVRYLVLPRNMPSEVQFEALVARYKEFRLLSLQLSPECFGSSHAREVAFTQDTWASRISNPEATNIVAVNNPAPAPDHQDATERDEIELLSKEWFASLTLIGPLEPETAFDLYKTHMQLDPTFVDFGVSETGGARWHFILNAMYVIPSARGRGIGRGIVEFAKNAALGRGQNERVRMVLLVDYDNIAARTIYESCGFATVHRYWFDDTRPGRGERTEAAVMQLELP